LDRANYSVEDRAVGLKIGHGRDRHGIEERAVAQLRREEDDVLGSPTAEVFDITARSPLRPPSFTRSYRDGRLNCGLPAASEAISSSVAVCRSCVSLRDDPTSTPWVKTL
jgi:hypothetical protein